MMPDRCLHPSGVEPKYLRTIAEGRLIGCLRSRTEINEADTHDDLDIRKALIATARTTQAPVMLMVAENDGTTI